jgi:hypothetical protein
MVVMAVMEVEGGRGMYLLFLCFRGGQVLFAIFGGCVGMGAWRFRGKLGEQLRLCE